MKESVNLSKRYKTAETCRIASGAGLGQQPFAFGLYQLGDERQIAFKKIQPRQFCHSHPANLLKDPIANFALKPRHAKKPKADFGRSRIDMSVIEDFYRVVNLDPQFFFELSSKGVLMPLTDLHFSARKLPLQRKNGAFAPLAHQ